MITVASKLGDARVWVVYLGAIAIGAFGLSRVWEVGAVCLLQARHGGIFILYADFQRLPLYFRLGCINGLRPGMLTCALAGEDVGTITSRE